MAIKRSNLDHVRLDLQSGRMFCKHCSDEYLIKLPVDLDIACAIARVFSGKHRNCLPSKVELGTKAP